MKLNLFRILKIESALAGIAFLVVISLMASDPGTAAQIADSVRSVIGPAPVAFAENLFYGLTDTLQRATFHGSTTPGYWTIPTASPAITPQAPDRAKAAPGSVNSVRTFQPPNVTPLYPSLAVPGEGTWVPLPNSFDPTAPPLMFKTFLHADAARPYARVAIAAVDLTRLRLHVVAGTVEPASVTSVPRVGLVSKSDLASLVAVFNGGFKAVHGHYGMMVDRQNLLPPQPNADTIALYQDGHVRIAPWSVISDTLPLMQSYRQTPAFLAYRGRINPALVDEHLVLWGAAVSGNTAIWRSALGLSADGQTLYYATGESLTAERLAESLVAAGAHDAAELDVNASHEQFLIYAPTHGNYSEQALIVEMTYRPGEFVSVPSLRDFFYLTLAK
jgi:hypothetical protein